MSKSRILVVEDDHLQQQELVRLLAETGSYEVEAAGSGMEALAFTDGFQPELVILDLDLPGDVDGFAVAREIVSRRQRCSIVMLTRFRDEDSRVEGLESGAVSYLEKPIVMRTLLSQIKSILASHRVFRDNIIQIGGLTLHPRERMLSGCPDGESEIARVKLTDMQTRLLQYLHGRRGRYATDEELLREVWGYAPNTITHTVSTHVHRVRAKLRERGFSQDIIVNRPRMGYRLAE